jgi:3',5'-cyclic AMP phosphodiesterase CpdA
VERILSEKASFVLHTGDLVSNGSNPEDWNRFFEIEKDLLSTEPLYPTLGNHDRNDPVFFKYFSFPGGNGHRFSFNWGSAHIAALDTNEVGDSPDAKAAFLNEEVEWLRQDLRRNKKPLTFVFMHHPLYTAVENRRASAARLAEKLEPVMIEGGVTAVFAGHDHNYQHHLKGALHFIVTGGGGAPLYDVSPIPGITLKALKTENYVRVRVDGRQAKVEAFDIEGSTIDSFELQGRP